MISMMISMNILCSVFFIVDVFYPCNLSMLLSCKMSFNHEIYCHFYVMIILFHLLHVVVVVVVEFIDFVHVSFVIHHSSFESI